MSWEAIRALPLCRARLSANGKIASLYIPGEDLEVAEAFHPPIWRSHHPSEPSVFDVYQAAAGARALLEEHDRVVELLRGIIIACEHKDIGALTKLILQADVELEAKK